MFTFPTLFGLEPSTVFILFLVLYVWPAAWWMKQLIRELYLDYLNDKQGAERGVQYHNFTLASILATFLVPLVPVLNLLVYFFCMLGDHVKWFFGLFTTSLIKAKPRDR